MHERPRQPARGYILAATLLWLALLAVIAVRLAQRVDLLRQQSSYASDLADAVTNASSARALAIFRMATGRMAQNGFVASSGAALPLDGRYTAIAGDAGNRVSVSVQDERGLLSVNLLDRPVIAQLLVRQGVPEGSVDHLIDSLEDYTDTDSLRRLNGAEAPDYEALGLPPPRNDWLVSPQELRQVIGWRDYPQVIDKLLPLLSARRDGFYNANASPRAVLAARFPRAPQQQIDQFMTRRGLRPFASAAEARSVTGLPFSDDLDLFHPSDQYRLTIRSNNSPIGVEYTIRLTPGGAKRPWQFLDGRTVFLEEPTEPAQEYDAAPGSRTPFAAMPDDTPPPEAF